MILGGWHNDIVANGTFSIDIYGLVQNVEMQRSRWLHKHDDLHQILGPKSQELSNTMK